LSENLILTNNILTNFKFMFLRVQIIPCKDFKASKLIPSLNVVVILQVLILLQVENKSILAKDTPMPKWTRSSPP